MIARTALLLSISCALGLNAGAQNPPAAAASRAPALLRGTIDSPTRAIRRDVPLTNAIRRAFEAQTRDFTGRPGPNYWQLQTDFTINARLDPATHTLTGSETILIHNNSDSAMNQIVLRLDHNIFRATVPRGSSVPAETTEGMIVTRIAVNGQNVNLNPAAGRGGRRQSGRIQGGRPAGQRCGGARVAARTTSVRGLDQTDATISQRTPSRPWSQARPLSSSTTPLPCSARSALRLKAGCISRMALR